MEQARALALSPVLRPQRDLPGDTTAARAQKAGHPLKLKARSPGKAPLQDDEETSCETQQ